MGFFRDLIKRPHDSVAETHDRVEAPGTVMASDGPAGTGPDQPAPAAARVADDAERS